jgi:tetratricopeptide (TPR) repeat protein
MLEKWNLAKTVALTIAIQSSLFVQGSQAENAQPNWSSIIARGERALQRDNLKEAEVSFRQALAQVQMGGHSADDVALTMTKLADTLALRRDLPSAESYYERTLNVLEKAYGTHSSKVVPALFALGAMYESEGNSTRAMALYNKAFAINDSHSGTYSPAVVRNLDKSKLNTPSSLRRMNLPPSALSNEPGLDASVRLAGRMKAYDNNLLKKNRDGTSAGLDQDYANAMKSFTESSLSQNRKPSASEAKSAPQFSAQAAYQGDKFRRSQIAR